MKTKLKPNPATTVAVRVAGEDIANGDYVTVLSEIIEWPSFFWSCSPVSLAPGEPVRIQYLPRTAGRPHRVIAVCLPFVYTEEPMGKLIAFDVRQHQLVKLDQQIGEFVSSRLEKARRKRKKK